MWNAKQDPLKPSHKLIGAVLSGLLFSGALYAAPSKAKRSAPARKHGKATGSKKAKNASPDFQLKETGGPGGLLEKGAAAIRSRQYAKAVSLFQQGLTETDTLAQREQDPTVARDLKAALSFNLGIAYEGLGKWTEAARAYNGALSIERSQKYAQALRRVLIQRAIVQAEEAIAKERYAIAIKILESARKRLKPEDARSAQMLHMEGLAHYFSGESGLQNACSRFKQAYSLDRSQAVYRTDLKECRLRWAVAVSKRAIERGEYSRPEPYLRKAYRAAANADPYIRADLAYWLGRLLLELGRTDEADQLIKEALSVDSSKAEYIELEHKLRDIRVERDSRGSIAEQPPSE